jgi:hypothetical protein
VFGLPFFLCRDLHINILRRKEYRTKPQTQTHHTVRTHKHKEKEKEKETCQRLQTPNNFDQQTN